MIFNCGTFLCTQIIILIDQILEKPVRKSKMKFHYDSKYLIIRFHIKSLLRYPLTFAFHRFGTKEKKKGFHYEFRVCFFRLVDKSFIALLVYIIKRVR